MSRLLSALIATTRSDTSLGYFLGEGVCAVYFEDDLAAFTQAVAKQRFDIVYIRDPFNTGKLPFDMIVPKLETIHSSQPDAYYVDQASTIDDALVEDKWRQYRVWQQWMPRTWLGGDDPPYNGELIAKKRISARSRDILFEFQPSELSSEWIIQERLSIEEEFRVYVLFGRPVREVSVRRSRTPGQTTKVTRLRAMSDTEANFVGLIAARMEWFDLVGLDIASTAKGLRLIEVNRSPQLKRYNELSGGNLVQNFWKDAAKRRPVA